MPDFTLQFVRHGISVANENGVLAGWTDVGLSKRGIEDLARIRRLYRFLDTERYYSSDLVRCRDTFSLLFSPEHDLSGVLPEFREVCFGSLDGIKLSPTEMEAFFARWVKGERIEDEESLFELEKRSMAALSSFLARMEMEGFGSATIVSHAGFIRSMIMSIECRPAEDFLTLEVPNGRGYIFRLCSEQGKICECDIEKIPAIDE